MPLIIICMDVLVVITTDVYSELSGIQSNGEGVGVGSYRFSQSNEIFDGN